MKNKLPKYDNYKPSNVDGGNLCWLGEIPQHWEVKKLKDICQINRKSLPENTNKNFSFEYVDIGSVNFEKGIINTETFIFKNAPSRARRIAEIGDTIISTVRTYLKAIDYIGDSKDKYIYSTGFAILTPKETHSKYLSMAVKSDSFTNQVDIFSTGMSYPAINSTELGRLKIAIPPLSEQEKIAQFLDEKTTKIDKAIEIKQRQIELLKERRQILIHRAVTKGLNHDCEDLPDYHDLGIDNESTEILQSSKSSKSRCRQSGVEWIGEILEHWEVSKVKWELEFHNNRRIPIEASKRGELQGEYPYYGASGIIDYVYNYIFEGKYILVGEDGANILNRSTPLAFIAEGKFWVNNHAHILKAKNFQDDFFAYQIEMNDFTNLASGSAQPKLTKDALANLQLFVPPIEEQKAIVSHIENISAKISKAIGLKEREMAVLKEYKSSLINSAVTGKVRVF